MNKKIIEAPAFPPGFHQSLGHFHGLWLMFDVTLDYSIGKFLRLEHSETHILVAGMEFGRKICLLCELLKHADHPKRQQLIEQLAVLQASKRDMITHAYIASNSTDLTFIYRSRGQYEAKELRFTYPEFAEHVASLVETAQQYQRLLGVTSDELISFANTALSLKKGHKLRRRLHL